MESTHLNPKLTGWNCYSSWKKLPIKNVSPTLKEFVEFVLEKQVTDEQTIIESNLIEQYENRLIPFQNIMKAETIETIFPFILARLTVFFIGFEDISYSTGK